VLTQARGAFEVGEAKHDLAGPPIEEQGPVSKGFNEERPSGENDDS